jgi:sarcosine oxidase subunit beta
MTGYAKAISHYDAVILGAGSIGVPLAWKLAEARMRVLVLDRGASVGQEANKAAIGGVRATHSDPAKIQLCQRSLQVFSTWQETYGDDIEWRQGGYTFVAYREEEARSLKSLLVKQKALGLNIDWLEARELLEVVPDLARPDLLGGTFSPQDGNASSLLSNHAMYRQAVSCGAEFHFHENMVEILVRNGRSAGIRTNRAAYHTDWVINAAGAGARAISLMTGVDLPVTPDSHEAGITEPTAPLFDAMVVDIRPSGSSANFYFYQHATGQIIFCITPSPNLWGFDIRETSQFLPLAARRLVEVMPRLVNLKVRRTWRGLYPMTPDGSPLVGEALEVKGFYQAAGMCGQGFMLGPGLAEFIQRDLCGQILPSDQVIVESFSPYRVFAGQEILK